MGNRAVIVSKDTTKENANQKIGIYLHWYGSEETVKEFLQEAKNKGVRNPVSDPSYGWARLCQIITDSMTKDCLESEYETSKSHAYETGIGIGIVSQLDTHNYDNGVYYIDENWEIVNHTDGSELEESQDNKNKEPVVTYEKDGKTVVGIYEFTSTVNNVEQSWYGVFDLVENEWCIDNANMDLDEASNYAEQYMSMTYGEED